MDLFQLCLCLRAADSIDGYLVVALKFFNRRTQQFTFRPVERPSLISEIVQPSDLARDGIDRVEMSDEHRRFEISEFQVSLFGGACDAQPHEPVAIRRQ